MNYRQDLKQIEEHFFLDRRKVLSSSRTYQASSVEDESSSAFVCFQFKHDEDDTRSLRVNQAMLTKRSEYFSAMLSGRFVENASPNDTIQLKDVSYELFATIVELLEFDLESKSDGNNSLDSICFSSKLKFESFVVQFKDIFESCTRSYRRPECVNLCQTFRSQLSGN